MIREGDHIRLTAALRTNSDDLLRYFIRRLDPEDAADAFADVMAIAWKRLAALPVAPEESRMWLFGIARNVLMHAQRGRIRRSRLAERLRGTLVERVGQGADQGIEIRDAVNRLDEDLAELVRLVHWDGLTLVDAASLLGIPASTARGRYQRAKEALRDALEPSLW